MSIAVFKPLEDAGEGEKVWGKLAQKVVDETEHDQHIASGWFASAQEALDAADLAKLEKENAALQAQIADEQVKLDGRTKAAKELKAKLSGTEETAQPAA
jgi:hypothetical protein